MGQGDPNLFSLQGHKQRHHQLPLLALVPRPVLLITPIGVAYQDRRHLAVFDIEVELEGLGGASDDSIVGVQDQIAIVLRLDCKGIARLQACKYLVDC